MTLEEYNSLYESLIKNKITEDNLVEFHKFTRFSPERFAKRLGIDELEFIKKCNSDKKEIHNKILGWKRIKNLKGYNPKSTLITKNSWNRSEGKYEEIIFNYRVCVCTSYVRLKYNWGGKGHKFYEDIKYRYSYDPFNSSRVVLLNEKNTEFNLSLEEFNEHFNDYRDQLLNDLLN